MEALRAHPLLTSLLMLVAPVALAVALGRAARARRWGPIAAPVAGAVAVGAAWRAIPSLEAMSPYDLLLMTALFAVALVVTSQRWLADLPRPVLGVSAALLVLGVAGLELRARSLPAPPMHMPPPEQHMLVMRRDAREFGVTAVYPDVYPPPWLPGVRDTAAMAHRAQGRRVLHLGDSMVAAGDVGAGQGFADVLSQSTGDDHVNMGVSNSSTDLHLVVFRRWQGRLHGDAAVLHLFTGNDLEEMDRPYSFCDAGPLLGPRAEGMPLHCPQPRWNLSRRVLLGQGPSPYPVRVLAWYSALARQLTWRFELLMRESRTRSNFRGDGERQWSRIGDALATLRDEAGRAGVPLAVSVLPHHEVLDARDARQRTHLRERHARFVALVRASGVRTLDPLPALEAAVRERPGARWFLPPSPHFDVDGHRWYAAWLAPQLPR